MEFSFIDLNSHIMAETKILSYSQNRILIDYRGNKVLLPIDTIYINNLYIEGTYSIESLMQVQEQLYRGLFYSLSKNKQKRYFKLYRKFILRPSPNILLKLLKFLEINMGARFNMGSLVDIKIVHIDYLSYIDRRILTLRQSINHIKKLTPRYKTVKRYNKNVKELMGLLWRYKQ